MIDSFSEGFLRQSGADQKRIVAELTYGHILSLRYLINACDSGVSILLKGHSEIEGM